MRDPDATAPVPRPTPTPGGGMTDSAVGALFDAASPAFATQRTSPSRGWEPPSVEDLQRLLPQYEISAFLARGGMGAVYKGMQRTLKRAVAIKVLPPDMGEDDGLQFAERFKREAQAMARLSHPNIVAVFEAGEVGLGQGAGSMEQGGRGGRGAQSSHLAPRDEHSAADGGERSDNTGAVHSGESARLISQERDGYRTGGTLLYFVMEFIEGTDVAQLIASEGRLDEARTVKIISAVCEALAFAHEEDIVHRDIKPSNVMIDRRGRVKVADFGLAKTINVESTMLTRSDVAMGTPDFVAPEALIAGTVVDGRADIYAVGVMLYQMLTGHIPRGRFALPSGVISQIDARFDAIVDRAMQTHREQRYSTATELKMDIETVGQALRLPPVTPAAGAPATQSSGVSALPSGGTAATKEKAQKSGRAPLLIGIAAAIVIGVGAWVMMDQPTGAKGLAEPASRPVTMSPASFPTGQWVRPFRQASDLHANWINGGATFVDGWITPGAGTNQSITLSAPNGRGKNWGVRARYRWSGRGRAFLVLRRGGSAVEKNVATYELRVEKGTAFFRRVQGGGNGGGSQFFPIGESTPVTLTPDTEILVEAFIIGRTLHGRVNGVVLSVESDGVLAEGGFEAASEGMPYRDLEFINLDGLSEAEALKLVGLKDGAA